MEFAEGDILVIPHEDSHAMCSAPGLRSGLSEEDSLDFFRAMAAGQLAFVVAEGGDGPLGCEARPFNPLLGALPSLIRIRRAAGAPIPGRFQGVLAAGVITAADLVGPLAGQTLADLVAAIKAGNTYVNVHTAANPGGEIRGQIR